MMLGPVYMATSNVAKFLQARLVLGKSGIEVGRFEAHRLPYREPYGMPRASFLQAGLDDVTNRAGYNRLVFIEDTTVKFPALDGRVLDGPVHDYGYPGQPTKEWFAAAAHQDILGELDKVGDRTTIVRSDLALHVPGLSGPIIFSATVEGKVVGELPQVQENRLYPWLGRTDFSSWFVPAGASKVLAAMQLEESLRYDFRAKALEALSERLVEYDAVVDLPLATLRPPPSSDYDSNQLPLFEFEDSRLIIIVIGSIASGKTTLGHYLELNRGFLHIEGSVALRKLATQFGLSLDGSNFDIADSMFESKGFDVVEGASVIPAIRRSRRNIVYTGCRTVEGVLAVKNAVHDLGHQVVVVGTTAPSTVRLSRALARAREDQQLSPLMFERTSSRDESYGAARATSLVCDEIIKNERDIGSFLGRVDEYVNKLQYGQNGQPRQTQLSDLLANTSTDAEVIRILRRISSDLLEDSVRLSQRGESLVRMAANEFRLVTDAAVSSRDE